MTITTRFNGTRRKRLLLVPLCLALVLAFGACSGGVAEDRVVGIEGNVAALQSQVQTLAANAGKVAETSTTRHYFVTAVEWKGTTSADSLDPPTLDPKTLSDGYGFNPTGFDSGNPRNWRVASYVWSPASMIAYQGDKVDLTIFVLNGNEHETYVETPSGDAAVQETEMNRGREYKFSFTASEVGTYQLVCNTHEPTMTGYIQVLPR